MDYSGLTDKGNVRPQNQDAFYCDSAADGKKTVLLVCDGMGGAKGGNVASELAVAVFKAEVQKLIKADTDAFELGDILTQIVSSANAAVFQLSRSSDMLMGMGTTLVGAVVSDSEAVVVNVGDSRCYIISHGEIRQITKDHSLVENMVDRGDITREQSRTHPNKNLITRAVGTLERVESDVFTVHVDSGDYLVLCSDGLSNELTDDEIKKEILSADTVSEGCERLMGRVLSGNARDNVTVVLYKN